MLAMPANSNVAFSAANAVVARAMEEAEMLPVIPREIEDNLTIKTSDRHPWLADDRMSSAGIRTVWLNVGPGASHFPSLSPSSCESFLIGALSMNGARRTQRPRRRNGAGGI
jgi:hypothetical protein